MNVWRFVRLFRRREIERPSSPFTAEAPITALSQDALGRGKFAEQLAQLLRSWRDDHSLIVAIRGKWGDGKSSLKNLILLTLSDAEPKPKIVEFNPWRYGDSKAISIAFYDEIARAIGQAGGLRGRDGARLFRSYSRKLEPLSKGMTAVGKNLPAIMGWFASFGFLTAALKALPIAAIAGWTVGAAAAVGIVGKVIQFLLGEGGGNEPLEATRKKLRKKLQALDTPILVLIDDIDRLEPDEIRTVFRHVKANADFPNITYLMLFQRDIVERALSEISGGEGRAYLEKIVQAAFDLPAVEPARIHGVFYAALERVLEGYVNPESGFDAVRWGNVFHGGLKTYLGNLRDVHRFIASLSVHLALHRGSRVLEVNVIDFIAIEALRLFEPDVFSGVASAKPTFTGAADAFSSSGLNEISKARVKAIVDQARVTHVEAVQEIITQLFPTVEWTFGGTHYASEFVTEWAEARRVCTKAYFDRYFTLRLPDDAVSDSEFVEILESGSNPIQLHGRFEDIAARGLLAALFERFDARRNKMPLDTIAAFLPPMMEYGESFDADVSFGIQSPYVSAWRSIYWYLLQEEDPVRRGENFLNAMRATEALAVAGTLIIGDVDRRTKGATDRILLTDTQLATAKTIWVNKFMASLANLDGALRDHRFMRNLYNWLEFGGEDEVKAFVLRVARTPEHLVPLLKAFRTPMRTYSFGDHVEQTIWKLDLKALARFVDWDTLKALGDEVDTDGLDDDSRGVVEELQKAETPVARHEMDDD